MVKTQVYMPEGELRELNRLARQKGRRMADLVREAVRRVWLEKPLNGPVALSNGQLRGTSAEHDAAFDDRGGGQASFLRLTFRPRGLPVYGVRFRPGTRRRLDRLCRRSGRSER